MLVNRNRARDRFGVVEIPRAITSKITNHEHEEV